MAAWHYRFELVPDEEVGSLAERAVNCTSVPLKLPRVLDSEGHQGEPRSWRVRSPGDLVPFLLEVMAEISSAYEEARMFGEVDGSRVEVWSDAVRCRIDLRNVSAALIAGILGVASKAGCKIVADESGKVLDPDFPVFSEDVKASRAYRFCSDPTGFLGGQI